jgi:hypothetical protein
MDEKDDLLTPDELNKDKNQVTPPADSGGLANWELKIKLVGNKLEHFLIKLF